MQFSFKAAYSKQPELLHKIIMCVHVDVITVIHHI